MVAGRPPALIFVVRHGARLDAADKEWHLTSPTPYDPPLTYGGWTQCRALGARIASILLGLEAAYLEEEVKFASKDNAGKPRAKRKKHRVILHTSPYLRCIQTSVAIAAGMSQFHGLQNDIRTQQRANRKNRSEHKESKLETITDDEQDRINLRILDNLPIKPFPKVKVKIDAFLGEWFSPEYYEHITHPPSTVLMLAGAKAELLRRGESIDGSEFQPEPSPKPNFFPGGWGSPISAPDMPERKPLGTVPPLPELEPLSPSNLPVRRDRATTFGNARDSQRLRSPLRSVPGSGYVPPNPRYAIVPNDPIPRGYTAHAQEACVEVDYSWDSTRPPQNWGDGGEYGEEWSSMHKRFRSGIARMVNWYSLHYESTLQSHGHLRALHPVHEEDTDDDCEVDTVLILVTHSAGCNALIGALTDQPVLMDVAMASLTMAMRRDLVSATDKSMTQTPASSNIQSRFSSSEGSPLSQEYNVSITASVDHLRAGTGPLSIPILQDPSLAFRDLFIDKQSQKQTTVPYVPQRRYKMNKSSMVMSSPIDQSSRAIPRSMGLVYGGNQRRASVSAWSERSNQTSLWATPTQAQDEPPTVSKATTDTDMHNLDNERQNAQESTPNNISSTSTDRPVSTNPQSEPQSSKTSQAATASTGLWPAPESGSPVKSSPGLWSARRTSNIPSGPPPSMPLEVSERSAAAKRRWTVNENSGM